MLRLLNIPFLDTRVIGMVKKSMLLHIRVEAKSNSICRGNIIDPDALTQLVNGIFLTPRVVRAA